MELPSQEGEMAIPLNSSCGGGGMIHHDHNNIPSAGPQITPSGPMSSPIDDHHHVVVPFKKMIRYKECLKNHAASMGGNATDGCGEFMPGGEEGSLEALTCSVCNCHRNFHRKEIEGEPLSYDNNCYHYPTNVNSRIGMRRPFIDHHHSCLGYHNNYHSRTVAPPHQMIMPYSMSHESDYDEGGVGGLRPSESVMVKKRFRTKFTQEQKDKMFSFAEKVGWKIQKQEESVVQQFCQEIGIKRRVLKVWMHNNKNNLAKKNLHTTNLV